MKPTVFPICALLFAASSAPFAKAATTTVLPDLSPSAAVVPETNCAARIQWPATGEVLRFGFDLRFEGAVSNAIEVSFGTDADGDGRLGFHERELTVGWRGGRYFVCNGRTHERLFSPPSAGRSFGWHQPVPERGGPPTFRGDGIRHFSDLSNRPDWILFNRNWTHLQLTLRGSAIIDRHPVLIAAGQFFTLRVR